MYKDKRGYIVHPFPLGKGRGLLFGFPPLAARCLQAQCKAQVSYDYSEFIKNAEESIQQDPAKFWEFVKSKKVSKGIPADMTYENRVVTNEHDIADYFAGNYVPANVSNWYFPSFNHDSTPISLLNLSVGDVFEKLQKLKVNKSPGPDGLPPLLLRNFRFALSIPLSKIYSHSLQSGEFPTN